MKEDNVVAFKKPGEIEDTLMVLLREGARKMLATTIEQEVSDYLARFCDEMTEAGHHQVVRNGYLPERTLQTGLGDLPIKVPRTRDRSGQGRIFHSQLLPPYLKRAKHVEELLPWLYLKGLSTNDFPEALQALLGKDAKGLSPQTICRLKSVWEKDLQGFQTRDLSGKRYAYLYADGVYFQARMSEKQCMLVLLGVDETGKKELISLQSGLRESEISWSELLMSLKKRGLEYPPKLAIGDGALGFWKALHKCFDGQVQQQRCWFHKAGNVLSKLPKSLQKQANKGLQEIWMSPTKEDADKAFDTFVKIYGSKYPKAVACLEKDREELMAFYAYPAAHWASLRTTNPIESVFGTVRLRTAKTRGCLSHKTGELMAFKLMESASKRWKRLNGFGHVEEVIRGVPFRNGERVENQDQKDAA